MPNNRPSIPIEVTREILIESGHRCAVCGTPTPIEQAHIIPWHKSKDHNPENLIGLCANCHARADKENWGEKTLREYKKKPWVLRQVGTADINSVQSWTEIKLTIKMSLEDFVSKDQKHLLYAIAAYLNISPDYVRLTRIEEGSVKVTIEIPSKYTEMLNNVDDLELAQYLAPLILLNINQGRTRRKESLCLTPETLRGPKGGYVIMVEICSGCRGSGKIKCPICGGSGRVRKQGPFGGLTGLEQEGCRECQGTGRLLCQLCGGVGKLLPGARRGGR